jgi:hypothetical protein
MFSLKYIKKVSSFLILLSGFSIIFATDIYNNTWALLVGIEKYTAEGISELNYAVDDAEAIRKVLIEQHNVNPDNISLLLNDDATKRNIERGLIDYYKNSDSDDRIIFYFSGHGVTEPTEIGGEMGYLVPSDVQDIKDIVTDGIDMESLKKHTYFAKAKHILFLIDACYGGLAAIGTKGIEYNKVGDANWRKITKGKARKIITAGRKDEQVQERSEWGHSAFARNILRGIGEERGADMDNDNHISANELGVYLTTKVSEDTDGMQTPQSDRLTSDDGEFLFMLSPLEKEEVQEKQLPIKTSSLLNESVDISNNLKALENMIRMARTQSQPSITTIYRETDIEKSSIYADLLVGNIGFIDNESLEGKWLKLPSLSFPQFDRISGMQVGLEKEVTSSVPFTYHADARFLYSHSRKDVDYSVLVKRYLLNKKNHTLSARYAKEVNSYDNWTVNYPDNHHSWMAFLFNMDQMDHFHSEGYTLNHHYYNDRGFSTDIRFINERQAPIKKHSDFSLVGFMADYRENYFNHDSVFNTGQLSSISIDFGFFGSTDEYRLSDNRVEIGYQLNELDLPLEYHLNYNIINIPSDTLISEFDNNAIIYSNLHNWVDTTILNPIGEKYGVRKFEMGNKLKTEPRWDVIEYNDFPVKLNETYIFSFYVRTEFDTANISIILKDHLVSNEGRIERISNVGTDWKRVWIKKTFNYIDLDKEEQEPKAWINIIGPKPIYIWGMQLEKADVDQEEPREYVSTDGNWSDIEVFLVPESPNWGWKSIKLLDNGDGYYTARPLLARGIYAYRLKIGDNIFIDPKSKETTQKLNGDEVSIITVGSGPPKINIGLEYSSPEMGSDFEFTKMTYNIRHSFSLSYYETIYMRLSGGVLEGNMQPIQKQFYLGNVGTIRGYNVKEFTGNKMALINLEYHVNLIDKLFSLINYKKWWIGDMGNQRISEIEYRAGLIKEHFEVDVDPVPYFKPFLFYDIGMIGSRYDGNNIYHSAGLGVNIYGFQFMLASRLDRDVDNWSVLFDFAGFFGRKNYLAK